MTSTSTTTMVDNAMISSISSLASASPQPPNVARIYKQSFQFFITRRTREALDALESILEAPFAIKTRAAGGRNHADASDRAPVASASKNARIKIWNLYLSILNAVVDMGHEDGKKMFGLARWKKLASKVKEGRIWGEIVQNGYNGLEENMDAEVVTTLATFLIAHAPTQKLTQQRLETYLSTLPPLSLAPETNQTISLFDGAASSRDPTPNKEFDARLKLVEIFTLHVLPRNEEWEYAKEFINNSEILDRSKKDEFLQTLQAVRDRPQEEERERSLQQKRAEELEEQRREEQRRAEKERRKEAEQRRDEVLRRDAVQREAEDKHAREAQQARQRTEERSPSESSSRVSTKPVRHSTKTEPDKSSFPASNKKSDTSSAHKEPLPRLSPKAPPPAKVAKAAPTRPLGSLPLLIKSIQQSFHRINQSLRMKPFAILRTILFVVALLLTLARRDVRDRLSRMRDTGWEKVMRTVGMGVKVSYI